MQRRELDPQVEREAGVIWRTLVIKLHGSEPPAGAWKIRMLEWSISGPVDALASIAIEAAIKVAALRSTPPALPTDGSALDVRW